MDFVNNGVWNCEVFGNVNLINNDIFNLWICLSVFKLWIQFNLTKTELCPTVEEREFINGNVATLKKKGSSSSYLDALLQLRGRASHQSTDLNKYLQVWQRNNNSYYCFGDCNQEYCSYISFLMVLKYVNYYWKTQQVWSNLRKSLFSYSNLVRTTLKRTLKILCQTLQSFISTYHVNCLPCSWELW